MKRIVVALVVVAMLSGCALSGATRVAVSQSDKELVKWVEQFDARLGKMADAKIRPFTIYLVRVIGEDKGRLPREGERLIEEIKLFVESRPQDYKYTLEDRAKLIGSFDRLFIVLYESAGEKGISILKQLVPAIGGLPL